MALASGTRLGPYEIAAQIGEGGMGEVYRATDTNLGREIQVARGARHVPLVLGITGPAETQS